MRAVGEAAARGEHWSMNVRSGERYGPRVAFAQLAMRAETAEAVLHLLLAEGRLADEIVDKKSKKKGLVVVGDGDIFG